MRGTKYTLPVNYEIDSRLNRLNVYLAKKRVAKFDFDAEGAGWQPLDLGKEAGLLRFKDPEKAIEWWLVEEGYLKEVRGEQ